MNLLPITEKENLKKGLKNRFLIVVLFLITGVFFLGFITLLPSYFLTLGYFSRSDPADIYWEVENEEEVREILNLPTEIDSKLIFVESNIRDVKVIDSIYKIIDFLPKKVTLNSASFIRKKIDSKEGGDISFLITGTAFDRVSLVSFSTLLEESNLFSSVDVPVSSLTKDRNLPFSINLIIKNKNE